MLFSLPGLAPFLKIVTSLIKTVTVHNLHALFLIILKLSATVLEPISIDFLL